MSNLEDQIKKLQKRLKKKEYLEYILKSVETSEDPEYSEVKDDVVKLLKIFVDKAIDVLENVEKVQPTKSSDKVVQNSNQFEEEVEEPKGEEDPETVPIHVKMAFATDNRHLGGRDAKFISDGGKSYSGTIVGFDYPNVVLVSETGNRYKVKLEDLIIEE